MPVKLARPRKRPWRASTRDGDNSIDATCALTTSTGTATVAAPDVPVSVARDAHLDPEGVECGAIECHLEHLEQIDARKLWDGHQRQKLELFFFVRGRLRKMLARQGESPDTLAQLVVPADGRMRQQMVYSIHLRNP